MYSHLCNTLTVIYVGLLLNASEMETDGKTALLPCSPDSKDIPDCHAMDPCLLDACKHGGTCVIDLSLSKVLHCDCLFIYSGATCEDIHIPWRLYLVSLLAATLVTIIVTPIAIVVWKIQKRKLKNSAEDPSSESAAIINNAKETNVKVNRQQSHLSPNTSGDLATADPAASPPSPSPSSSPNPNASSSMPAASCAASSQGETQAHSMPHSNSTHLPRSDPQLNRQSTHQSQLADQPGSEGMRSPQQAQSNPASPQDQSTSTIIVNNSGSISGLHFGDVKNYFYGPGSDQGPGTEGESRGPITEETGANLSDRCEGETHQPSSQVPNSMHLGDNAGGNGAIGTAPPPDPTPPSCSSPSQGATATDPGSEALARTDRIDLSRSWPSQGATSAGSDSETFARTDPVGSSHPQSTPPDSRSPQPLTSDLPLYTEQTGPIHSCGPDAML